MGVVKKEFGKNHYCLVISISCERFASSNQRGDYFYWGSSSIYFSRSGDVSYCSYFIHVVGSFHI